MGLIIVLFSSDAITSLANYLILIKMDDVATLINNTYSESGYKEEINQLLDMSMNLRSIHGV